MEGRSFRQTHNLANQSVEYRTPTVSVGSLNYQYYLYVKDKRFHSSCRNVASIAMPIVKLCTYEVEK
jgi:hypothetical protein